MSVCQGKVNKSEFNPGIATWIEFLSREGTSAPHKRCGRAKRRGRYITLESALFARITTDYTGEFLYPEQLQGLAQRQHVILAPAEKLQALLQT